MSKMARKRAARKAREAAAAAEAGSAEEEETIDVFGTQIAPGSHTIILACPASSTATHPCRMTRHGHAEAREFEALAQGVVSIDVRDWWEAHGVAVPNMTG